MSDEIFDPEIHSADADGNPTLNKDGSFRKKRRDAGKKASERAPRTPRASRASKPAASDPRAKYAATLSEMLGAGATLWSMVDPVDGYCAARLVPAWSEVLADLAVEYPWMAAALEKAAPMGKMTQVVGLGVMTVVQFGHNHNKVPAELAVMAGATPRKEIEKVLSQRGEQLRRQTAEDKAVDEWATKVMADSEGAMSHA